MTLNLHMPEAPDRSTLLRLAFLSALSLLLLGALLARLWFLQVLAGDRFAELADSNRLRTVVSTAPRGHILASDGSELVRNRPALALTADRQLLLDDAGRPRSAEAGRAIDRLADRRGGGDEEDGISLADGDGAVGQSADAPGANGDAEFLDGHAVFLFHVGLDLGLCQRDASDCWLWVKRSGRTRLSAGRPGTLAQALTCAGRA
jgi:hypothetical protein